MLQYKTVGGAKADKQVVSNKTLRETNALISELKDECDRQRTQYAVQGRIQTIEELESEVRELEKILVRLVFAERKIKGNPEYIAWEVDPNSITDPDQVQDVSGRVESTASPEEQETKKEIATDRPSDETITKLNEWLRSHGCFVNDLVEVKSGFAEGTGIVATKDITAGTPILSIPRSIMLDAERSQTAPWYSVLLDRVPAIRTQPAVMLAINLLQECHMATTSPSASLFGPYLNSLPKSFTLPFFAMPNLMESRFVAELKKHALSLDTESPIPSTYVRLLRIARSMIRTFASIAFEQREARRINAKFYADLAKLPLISFEQFRWATCTVMARQNYIPKLSTGDGKPAGQQSILALIPGFDFLAHSSEAIYGGARLTLRKLKPEIEQGSQAERSEVTFAVALAKSPEITHVTGYDPVKNATVSETCLDTAAGQQVYTSYGTRNNEDLYLFQGFVLNDHPIPLVNVPLLFVDPAKAATKLRVTLLKRFEQEVQTYVAEEGKTRVVVQLPQLSRLERVLAEAEARTQLVTIATLLSESFNWRHIVLAALSDTQLGELLLATAPNKFNDLLAKWGSIWQAFEEAFSSSSANGDKRAAALGSLSGAVEESPLVATMVLPVAFPLLILESLATSNSQLRPKTTALIVQVLSHWSSVLLQLLRSNPSDSNGQEAGAAGPASLAVVPSTEAKVPSSHTKRSTPRPFDEAAFFDLAEKLVAADFSVIRQEFEFTKQVLQSVHPDAKP